MSLSKEEKSPGIVIDLLDQPPKDLEERLREIEGLLDEAPLIDPQMLCFYLWVSDYYLYPLGEVIKTGLPPGLHSKSELILSLTQDGVDGLTRGGLDPVQEKVFREIERCGQSFLKGMLKIFP